MALGKVNIYGSRITNGVWAVLTDGGWVKAELLTGIKHNAAVNYAATMPTEYFDRHAAGKTYTYDPKAIGRDDRGEAKGKVQPQEDDGGDVPAEVEADGDTEGDADDVSDGNGQGNGGGGDDDEPVYHSEFDPWQDKAEKVFKRVEKAEGDITTMAGKVGTVTDLVSKHERNLQRLQSEVSSLKINGGGGGDGKGVIVAVEIRKIDVGDIQTHEGFFHYQFANLVKNIAGGHHSYLPGPPGSGKSHAAKQAADSLGWRFGALSLGPTTPESRLWGGRDANNNFFEPPLVKLARHAMENPENGAVYCLDELDNGHPGIIATLNSGMANGWFEAPNGDLIEWGDNFVIVGSANTYGTGPTAEFSGRNRLDSATLDRFNFLPWDTDVSMETAMVKSILAGQDTVCADWLDVWQSARRNVESHGLKVFITMRGAIRGAKMLAQGRDFFETANEVLLNKLPEDQRAKVSPF